MQKVKSFLFGLLIRCLPKRWLSHFVGVLVHCPLPGFLKTWSLKLFAKAYKIDMSEAEKPLGDYKSVGDLFIRQLKTGARPIEGPWVHPADSEMTQGGEISRGQLIQCKGKEYTVQGLLRDVEKASDYEGGFYATYYLCPTDYHRVHSPVSGKITQAVHIPGYLWPVNSWSVQNVEGLFSINERVVTYIETEHGVVAVVMVGATNVGKMTMSYDPSLVIRRGPKEDPFRCQYDQPMAVSVGDELGIFHMGSSAVVLYPLSYSGPISKEAFTYRGPVRMGQSLKV